MPALVVVLAGQEFASGAVLQDYQVIAIDGMRSLYVHISSRLKQMPFALHAFTCFCIFLPIFALGFYYRGELPGGLPKVLLSAVGSAVFIYGFLQATRWSRPLLILFLSVSSVWAIFEHYATYSFLDYLGLLGTDGFIFWTLYLRRDVRDYYARTKESMTLR